MKKRHVIWDWNGTLLNDVQISHAITNEGLKRIGMPEITIEHSRRVFSFPVTAFYERIGIDLEKVPFHELQHHFHTEYERRRIEAQLHDGIETLLKDLKEEGRTQSILSAHPAATLRSAVSHVGIEEYFSEIVGAENNFGTSKIESAWKWMKETNRHGHDLVMVGDTTHDHEVAAELKIGCILVAHGYQAREHLDRCGVPVVDSVAELRNVILK